MIKNFSFLLSPKIWFEPIVFPGSLAVLSGAAPPPFRIFAGGFPRRNAFGLIQEYCTTNEVSWADGARKLLCVREGEKAAAMREFPRLGGEGERREERAARNFC